MKLDKLVLAGAFLGLAGAVLVAGLAVTTLTSADGLASDMVVAMTEDSTGAIWFGFLRGGASRRPTPLIKAAAVRPLFFATLFRVSSSKQ